jgi:hypothetical protein
MRIDQPPIKKGFRRPQRVQILSLFQLKYGATRKLKAKLILPIKEIRAGSAVNFRIVKVSGAADSASTITETLVVLVSKTTAHQLMRFCKVRIIRHSPFNYVTQAPQKTRIPSS